MTNVKFITPISHKQHKGKIILELTTLGGKITSLKFTHTCSESGLLQHIVIKKLFKSLYFYS